MWFGSTEIGIDRPFSLSAATAANVVLVILTPLPSVVLAFLVWMWRTACSRSEDDDEDEDSTKERIPDPWVYMQSPDKLDAFDRQSAAALVESDQDVGIPPKPRFDDAAYGDEEEDAISAEEAEEEEFEDGGDEDGERPSSPKMHLRKHLRRSWTHTNLHGEVESRLHKKPSPYKT